MKTTLIALLVAGLLLAGCSTQGNSYPPQGQGGAPQQGTTQSNVQANGPGLPNGIGGTAPDPQLLGSIDSTAQDLNSGVDSAALDDNAFLQVDNSTFQ